MNLFQSEVMADPPRILARTIGSAARQILAEASRGELIGLTSRGAFLRLEPSEPRDVGQWTSGIVFLSREPFRGPLTVNLGLESSSNLSLAHGDAFTVRDGVISFARLGLQVRANDAPVWSAPPRPASILPAPAREALFERVSRQIPAEREMRDLGALSGAQRSRSASGAETVAEIEHRSATIQPPATECHCEAPFAEAISSSAVEAAALAAHLISCLGRGSGLTPAGDDLVLGFLLALVRWGDALGPTLPADEIALPLIEAARKNTTSLSAQLLECAAQGQADERLISALDGLISGEPGEAAILEKLLDWGHTSGAAALRGMGLVVEAEKSHAVFICRFTAQTRRQSGLLDS